MYLTQIHRVPNYSVIMKKAHSAQLQLLSCHYPIMLHNFGPQISLEHLQFLFFEFVVLRHPTTKLLSKHRGMSIYFIQLIPIF